MRTAFLFGNGFDLNLDIKTRYADFYEYYRSVHSKDSDINNLKEEISKDLTNWADMELEFGRYSEKIKNEEKLRKIIIDIQTNLAEYLERQEEKFDFSTINKEKFLTHLSSPEEELFVADRNELRSFKSKFNSKEIAIDIITFNYTRIVEKIFEGDFRNSTITTLNNKPVKLKGIYHIHGLTDHRMIFGVNDFDQLSNEDFHNNQNVVEMIIKNECNKANRSNTDKIVESRIKSAHLICIFGSSIGDTDKCWWEFIGEQLKRDIKLIIFDRDVEIDPRFEHMQLAVERRKKREFLSKTNLTDTEKESVDSKIFIGLNTQMFNILDK